MSGFEIVGVVLGGIPIVLEAYNRYQTVSKTFSGFRQHSRALSRLDTILNAQKTIFRGDVTKLLTAVTNDAEKTRSLISGERSWDDLGIRGLDHTRAETLRDAFSSWKATLDEIHDSLQAICSEVESFRVSSTKPTQVLSVEKFRKQFKLCVKKDIVQEAIEDLRNFTADFNRITSQIIDELKDPGFASSSPDQPTACIKPSCWNSLEMYRQIRAASSSLYETLALRWPCALHQRHVASITFRGDNKQLQSQKGIKFEAVVTPSESETSPLWLEIDCIDNARTCQPSSNSSPVVKLEINKTWSNVVDTLRKHSQPLVLESAQRMPNKLSGQSISSQTLTTTKTTKVVRFQALSLKPNEVDDLNESQQDDTHQEDTQLTNLEVIDDICQHFQTTHSACEPTYVGYIQHSGLYRFYVPSSPRFPTSSQMSLAEMISWVAEDEISRNLPRSAMVQIASSLACAVLQYHSTPWLPEMWQSSHVRFFGIKDWLQDSTNLSLTSPYFKVEFSKADITGKGKAVDISLPYVAVRQVVRNEVLFSFGIVLLELGYSKPWHLLRPGILKNLPFKKQVDYHAAEKLAQSPLLRNRMGPRYATIVRKCLGCDFGLGENDLENEELQGIFLIDVVNALQEAAGGLRELERKLYCL
ncbi:hypothetical protein FVEN_g6812 [Fusarium venenatum]|uniref:DUF7580 domain-containing protein n=1 Tax=Fusarium venenatum TaxID=56646 RepID=A0A2L2TE36_9HYPO|nr:uncharacterized protein FVRRES_00203 [Fusarium venenatum]KAG8355375.1 hypothetical protein FVEN_g6812 [Fusarium venenatum]CEI63691.1 unnamed protein product [Fusarium venenatum]